MVFIVIVFAGGLAYALTSISQNNNVQINPGTAIGVSTSSFNPTTCPGLGTTSYSTASPYMNTVNWVITAGGGQTQWYCIENQGSGDDPTPSINLLNGKPTGITCAEPECLSLTTVPFTLPPLNHQSVSAPINVTLTVVADASGSGTATIVVT